jgi:hypothetical protein
VGEAERHGPDSESGHVLNEARCAVFIFVGLMCSFNTDFEVCFSIGVIVWLLCDKYVHNPWKKK